VNRRNGPFGRRRRTPKVTLGLEATLVILALRVDMLRGVLLYSNFSKDWNVTAGAQTVAEEAERELKQAKSANLDLHAKARLDAWMLALLTQGCGRRHAGLMSESHAA